METKGKQYKWKILAWNALRNSDSKNGHYKKVNGLTKKRIALLILKKKREQVTIKQTALGI